MAVFSSEIQFLQDRDSVLLISGFSADAQVASCSEVLNEFPS